MPARTRTLLTPKNVYRLLTGRLPGVYGAVLPEEQVRGLTLIRFWRGQLESLVSEETLDALFSADGSHPRIQSSLMNRSGNTMPRRLRQELDEKLSPDGMLRLIRWHMRFLSRRLYRVELFSQLLNAFEDQCFQDDYFIPALQREYLSSLRRWQPDELRTVYHPHRLFMDACRLSWLAVFSLYEAQMNCDALNRLCMSDQALPDALWRAVNQGGTASAGWRLLTAGEALIDTAAQPQASYIPAALRPEELSAKLRQSHRLLISGMGGVGKTELLRQALPQLRSVYRRAAYVQVEETLANSFVRAFPTVQEGKSEAVFAAVKTLLEEDKDTLLLLDNLPAEGVTEAEAAFLAGLTCDVLATGRNERLPFFRTLSLSPLGEAEAEQLFLQTAMLEAQPGDAEALRQLVALTGGHPLTLILLGHICRANYWTPATLASRLQSQGFQGLALVAGRQITDLYTALCLLFDLGGLTGEELRLLRLMALFPCVPWTAERLAPLAQDIPQTERGIPVQLQLLADRSWLTRGQNGYLLHPVISETVRIQPCACDEFPLLWRHWAEQLQPPLDQEKQQVYELALSALLRCQEQLNADAVKVLSAIEVTAMTRSSLLTRHDLPTLHQRWLDTQAHSSQDEVDFHIIRMLWALLGSHPEQYPLSAEALLQMPADLLQRTAYYDILCNVLEVGASQAPAATINGLFSRIRPAETERAKLILYLNFLGGKRRFIDKNPQLALATLTEARSLIAAEHLEGSVEEAANDTRTAYALADLGRWSETLPLMRRVMENLRGRGYAEDSQTMTVTRNSYDFFRGKCSEQQLAIDKLQEAIADMKAQVKEQDEEYLFLLQNYADLLMANAQYAPAEQVIREALRFCESLPESAQPLRISTWVRMAKLLSRTNKGMEALGYITQAELVAQKHFGTDTPEYARVMRVKDDVLKAVGMTGTAACATE